MKIKPLVIAGAALLAALTVGVVSAGADQTFKSGLYQNQPYTCEHGSAIDPSGQSFGTFSVTEAHNNQLVQAYVTVDNMEPNLLYRVFVTEAGLKCISPTLAPGYEAASFWADAKGQGTCPLHVLGSHLRDERLGDRSARQRHDRPEHGGADQQVNRPALASAGARDTLSLLGG